jgi:hypothetical protein
MDTSSGKGMEAQRWNAVATFAASDMIQFHRAVDHVLAQSGERLWEGGDAEEELHSIVARARQGYRSGPGALGAAEALVDRLKEDMRNTDRWIRERPCLRPCNTLDATECAQCAQCTVDGPAPGLLSRVASGLGLALDGRVCRTREPLDAKEDDTEDPAAVRREQRSWMDAQIGKLAADVRAVGTACDACPARCATECDKKRQSFETTFNRQAAEMDANRARVPYQMADRMDAVAQQYATMTGRTPNARRRYDLSVYGPPSVPHLKYNGVSVDDDEELEVLQRVAEQDAKYAKEREEEYNRPGTWKGALLNRLPAKVFGFPVPREERERSEFD